MRRLQQLVIPLAYYLVVAGIISVLNICANGLLLRVVPSGFAAAGDLSDFIGLFFGILCCFGSLLIPWKRRPAALPIVRRGPILLGCIFICHFIAIAITFWNQLHHIPIFPSWADFFYLMEYPLLFLVLLCLPTHKLSKAASLRLVLDCTMVITVIGIFDWYFALGPILLHNQQMMFTRIIAGIYPFADVMVIFFFLMLAARSSALNLQPVKWLLLVGLVLLAAGDSVSMYRLWQDSALSDSFQSIAWAIAYIAFGISAYYMRFVAPRVSPFSYETRSSLRASSSEPLSSASSSFWFSLLPYVLVPAVMVLGLLAWRSDQPELLLRGVLLNALLFFGQVLLRQILTLHESRYYVRQLHQANSRLGELASTDPVTALPNHYTVMKQVEEELHRCQQMQQQCAILFVDIDYFKRVNDTWGHLAGDALLHEMGNCLSTHLRAEDFVGRYGGEEFAVVLEDVGVEEAYGLAERLRAAVAAHIYYWQTEEEGTNVPLMVTASIGVALYPLDGMTAGDLIAAADAAMYQAKHSGRNRVCLVSECSAGTQEMPGTLPEQAPAEAAALQALIAVASVHDEGTEAHCQRVVDLAVMTAHMLALPQEEIRQIRVAALLHDIGKLGIPDAILHKSTSLTSEEWLVMRRHPSIGKRILNQSGSQFEAISCVVAAHHERWDGQGYPSRLVEDEIPLGARILAVVDSYDAMTSRRVYHEPMPEEDARLELRHCSGGQFDPRVVEAFIQGLLARRKQSEISSGENVALSVRK